jgi:tripartite-type tricarboxylate transporter receptor subunit TctC
MRSKGNYLAVILLVGLAWAVRAPGAAAQSSKAYYEGKTIKILVSSSPGGGTDTTARLVSQFLPKFLPGDPQTVVQNMPGGGGSIANNHFTANGKDDGLMLFQDSSSGLGNFTRGGKRIKYDPRKYKAIGSVTRGGSLLMIRKDAHPRLSDPKAKKVVVGDTDGIRTWLAMGVYGAEFLGWNLRFVYGYPGTRELSLALRQGEVDIWGTQSAKIINEFIKDGGYDVLCQQEDERRPGFPNVPTFEEVLGDKKPKGVAWEAYNAWTGPNDIDKFLVAPESTPDHLVAMLRDAFFKMTSNEEFKRQATQFFGDAWRIRRGDKTQEMIRESTTISKKAGEYLTGLRKKYDLPTGEQKR